MSPDLTIILSAFERVKWLERLYDEDIPWSEIVHGFDVQGERLYLANKARGIFRPRQMTRGVLSIKTTVPRAGRQKMYDDEEMEEGFFRYALQRGDPAKQGNRYLWEAQEDQSSFIYFHAIAPGRYKAIWPCYVTQIHPEQGFCEVVVGNAKAMHAVKPQVVEYQKHQPVDMSYAVRETRVRLHQAAFRANVLRAYQDRCALSGLPVRQLLEAAHITPDNHSESSADVTNGIAMSRLHHTAYDKNLIGISPDFVISVSQEIQDTNDGAVLDALKGLEGKRIHLPRSRKSLPDRDRLGARYEDFLRRTLLG